jgi:hypothetical protein
MRNTVAKRALIAIFLMLICLAAWRSILSRDDAGDTPRRRSPAGQASAERSAAAIDAVEVKGQRLSVTSREPLPITPPAVIPSFSSTADVFDYAEKSLQSSSGAQVYEGRVAAVECSGFARVWTDYANFSAGGKSPFKEALTPERQLAIQGLLQRCAGFIRSIPESKKLVAALNGRFKEMGDGLSPAIEKLKNNPQDSASISALLFSGSPAATEEGLRLIPTYWGELNRIPTGDSRVESVLAAAFVAACDLGKDCSTGGYYGQLLCAIGGDCNGRLWSNWLEGLSEKQAADARKYRTQIVDAVRSRDLSRLKDGG